MSCKDCFQNCGDITSDNCTIYTGPDIPLLGICTGDGLSVVEAKIIESLLSALDGTGITVSEVNLENCVWLKNKFIGKDKTLANLIQLLYDSQCTLKQMIDDLTPGPQSFDTACLDDLPDDPTITDVVQKALILLCSLKATVDQIPSTYVKISDLTNLVIQIINTNSNSSGGTPVYKNRMVPMVAYEYYGPLSNFDNTGKGISTLGFDKVYLCNGANGTPDKRGRVAVGAVRNVPGGALDPEVDPANSQNAYGNVNYALLDKFGENFHKLTSDENAAHSHGITDPGHDHDFPHGKDEGGNKYGNGWMKWDADTSNKKTKKSFTNITVQVSGKGDGHNTRQPSIAANYIMYIP